MKRKLIIDGNAIYEIDEECMKKREREEMERKQKGKEENKKRTE